MNFQYHYNLTGSSRKPLVAAVSQILGRPAVYQGAPSFSYAIGDYTIDRDGVLSYSSDIHPDLVAVLINDLQERGFVAEKVAADGAADEPAADVAPTDGTIGILAEDGMPETATDIDADGEDTINESYPEEIAADEDLSDMLPDVDVPDKLTIKIPDTGFTPEAWENLKKIVKSKETLLKKALGASQLPITKADGRISFAWFTLQGLEGEADAYARLAAAICKMAKTQKRVTATEKPAENEKLAMRLFLVRLGFIGDEYKNARKILLKNLTGNSSWKSGHPPVREEGNPTVPPDPMEAATPAEEELDGFLPAETETLENELLKTRRR